MSQETMDRVIQLVAQQFGYEGDEVAEITAETTLRDDLRADSLELLDLSFAVEKEFGKEVDASAFERIFTVGDIAHHIAA